MLKLDKAIDDVKLICKQDPADHLLNRCAHKSGAREQEKMREFRRTGFQRTHELEESLTSKHSFAIEK